MAIRFALFAALLLAASHVASGQVVRTWYSDAECTTVIGSASSWVPPLGECSGGKTM